MTGLRSRSPLTKSRVVRQSVPSSSQRPSPHASCPAGVRDRLLEAPHKCRNVLVLNEMQVVVATCPSAAAR